MVKQSKTDAIACDLALTKQHRRQVGYRRAQKFVISDLYAESESEDDGASKPVSEEQLAAASAGLDHERVSFLEKLAFERQLVDPASEGVYLSVRNKIIQMWRLDVRKKLSVESCAREIGERFEREMVLDVFDWLERNGGINYGCLRAGNCDINVNDVEATTVIAAEDDGDANPSKEEETKTIIDDEVVTKELIKLLKTCDMNVETEKMIRKKLAAILECDLSDWKLLIKETVTKYLMNPEQYSVIDLNENSKDGGDDDNNKNNNKESKTFKWPKSENPMRLRTIDTATKPVIIIGAGPSGLACANQLKQRKVPFIILEARDRVGGRVWTERDSFSVPVDFGASIVTGTEPNPKARTGMPWLGIRADPSAEVSTQIDLNLVELRQGCPLYDGKDGSLVDDEKDARIEKLRDLLMDEAREAVEARGESATMHIGLGEIMEDLTKIHFEREYLEHKMNNNENEEDDDDDMNDEKKLQKAEKIKAFSKDDKRLLDWHWANLEYGCSAKLGDVSLPHWNQDEMYGGFGGPHCMVKNGYGQITDAMAKEISEQVKLNAVVKRVAVTSTISPFDGVSVLCANGDTYEGSTVVCTVPLGCLKNNDVEFVPELSSAKINAVERLGFGNLNKLVIEFEEQFWSNDRDYFGVAVDSEDENKMNNRARCFMFWNLKPVCGENILIALVAGSNAEDTEQEGEETQNELVRLAVEQLAKVHFAGDVSKIKVKTAKATAWGKDPFARGSYSYIKKNSRGASDYDELGRPELKGRLFFAGEHTCKDHPDTVGGAMLTGWRAARQVMQKLSGEEGKIFDEVFDLEEMRKKAEEEARQLALMEDSDYDSELEGEDFEKMKSAIERKRDAEERARNQVVDTDALAGRDEAKSVYKISMMVDSNPKASIGMSLAEIMIENENHYALKTGAGKRALMNAVLALSDSEKEKWAYNEHTVGFSGLATFNEWLTKFAKRARKEDEGEDAMTALNVIRSIPFDLKMMKRSGVPLTLKDYFQTHENLSLQKVSKAITREWMRLLAIGGGKTRHKSGGAYNGNILKAKQNNSMSGMSLLNQIKNRENEEDTKKNDEDTNKKNQLSDKELLVLHEKERKDIQQAAERKLREHRDAVVKAASDLPEGQAAIAAREAAEKAKAEAELAIEHAKEAARTAMEQNEASDSDDDDIMNINISSFEDFQHAANVKREKKRAKAKAKMEKRAREEEEDDDDDDDEENGLGATKKSKPSSSIAAAPTTTDEAYEERVTKQVTKYVFEQLKLKRNREILSKKQCKKYEEKIVRTVIDHAKSEGKLDLNLAFMTSQRKEKIKSLVNKYAVAGQKANLQKSSAD